MIVAKAATQTKMPIIGVDFMWSSKDADVASVDGGMIEALEPGSSEITVAALTRGIAVKFTVTVLSDVKSIVIDSPADGFFLADGESVGLEATAYDMALKDDAVPDDASSVPVDLTFMSSDDSVIEIDGSTAKAVGVGTATITAHYGTGDAEVKSKGIKINVTPGGDLTHKLTFTRIGADDRKFHIAWSHDSTNVAIYGPGHTVPDETPSGGTGGADVTYTVQVRIFDSEGNAGIDSNAAVTASLTTEVQGSGISNDGVTVEISSGIATITVVTMMVTVLADKALVASASNAVTGPGTARIILSYPGADDIALPAITVTEATEEPPEE